MATKRLVKGAPMRISKHTNAPCSCGCGAPTTKRVQVEYLYLDLNVCDRCMGTDAVLEQVLQTLTPALTLAGYAVELQKIEMKTEELAQLHRFVSSPTIRVNGVDVSGPVQENHCGCCSDISGADVQCRVFAYNGEAYEVPPKEMLAETILRAVFGRVEGVYDCGGYELPENLKDFFAGKKDKAGCSCGGNCC